MSRQTETAAAWQRENRQAGLVFQLEQLHERWAVPYGKVISKHLTTLADARALRAEWRNRQGDLKRQALVEPRRQREADALAMVEAIRKGEAVELSANTVEASEAEQVELARKLVAVEKVLAATIAEITAELYGGDYPGKLALAYAKVAGWTPKASSTWAEVQGHQGELAEFAEQAYPIVAALETLTASGVTTQERKQLREAFRAGPEIMPSLDAIRQVSRSRYEATPLAEDIKRRAEAKGEEREKSIAEAASAAAGRLGSKAAQADESAGSKAAKQVEEVPA